MRSGCACLLIIVIYFRRNSGSRGSDPSGPIDGNGGQSRTGSLSRPSVLDHATHKPASRRQASCPSCSDERCATLRHSAARFLQSSTLIIVAPHRQLQTQNSLSLHSERPSTIVDVLFGVPKLCPLCTACLSFRAAARYLPCSTADKLKSHGWTREQSGTSRYACVYPAIGVLLSISTSPLLAAQPPREGPSRLQDRRGHFCRHYYRRCPLQ